MAAPTTSSSSSSAATLIREQPKIIKSREDHSLYVKLSDLPEDIQEQLRLGGEEAEGISEATETEETSQLYDDVLFGGPCSPPSHRSRAPSNDINSMAFNEPMRLSAQPTVEEIQMCFAQIDLAILMNHHGYGKPHSRSRSVSPRKLHRHSSTSLAEAAPPLRPAAAAAAAPRTLSPSPRCKAKQTTAQQHLPSPSPPPPASPPMAAATAAPAPAPAAKGKEPYSPDAFSPDELVTPNKNESRSSGVKQSKNMEELLNCIGKRQGKNVAELKKQKGESKAMDDERNVKHQHHRHDEDEDKDDDGDNDEDEIDEEDEKGDRGRGSSSSRLKKRNETSSRRFCGGLSLLRDDFKAKLQQMHSKVLPFSGDACIYEGVRPKGLWSRDTHHVRYKSSWSGTSQEEYQIDPHQETDDE